MRIAFSVSGESLESPLDSRFGRAQRFLLYDLESGRAGLVENELGSGASQGAGIQAAEMVARAGGRGHPA